MKTPKCYTWLESCGSHLSDGIKKKYFFASCRAYDFLWRSPQIFSFILRSCHMCICEFVNFCTPSQRPNLQTQFCGFYCFSGNNYSIQQMTNIIVHSGTIDTIDNLSANVGNKIYFQIYYWQLRNKAKSSIIRWDCGLKVLWHTWPGCSCKGGLSQAETRLLPTRPCQTHPPDRTWPPPPPLLPQHLSYQPPLPSF